MIHTRKDAMRAVLAVPVIALAIAPRPAVAQQSPWTVGTPAYTMDAAGSVTDADGARLTLRCGLLAPTAW
jgi:hypothetical protein